MHLFSLNLNKKLCDSYYASSISLSALQIWTHLILQITLWDRYNEQYNPYLPVRKV